jgi:hypothetical protein
VVSGQPKVGRVRTHDDEVEQLEPLHGVAYLRLNVSMAEVVASWTSESMSGSREYVPPSNSDSTAELRGVADLGLNGREAEEWAEVKEVRQRGARR